MSRYLEFTTNTANNHMLFSLGIPVHDGKLPRRFTELRGLRIDGEPVKFVDERFADALHRAMVDGRALERRGNAFDCMVLSLLLESVELVHHAGRGWLSITPRIAKDTVSPDDASQVLPVAIGTFTGEGDAVAYRHNVSPAHTVDNPLYVHKLGDKGPICLSGLREACGMYGLSVANSITGMEVHMNDVVVAQWTQPLE